MGIHATALEKGLASEPHMPQEARRVSKPLLRAWSELSTRLFSVEPRSVVAFVSVHRGAGVTHTITGIADDLRRSGKMVAEVDGNLRLTKRRDSAGTELHSDPDAILGATFDGTARDGWKSLVHLRERYDIILLDCGSLENSTDLLRIAPEADGVVLTVEAGRTSKQQIERARTLISEAHGRLIGCAFNKRRYPIPSWLYRML